MSDAAVFAVSRSFSATAQSSAAQIFVLLVLNAQWIHKRLKLAAQPAADLRDCKKGGYTKLQVKLKVIEIGIKMNIFMWQYRRVKNSYLPSTL